MTPTLFIPGRNTVAAVTYSRPRRGVIKIRTHPSWLSRLLGSDRFYEGSGRSLGKPRPRLHTHRTRIRVQDASSAFLLTIAPTRESGSGDTMSIVRRGKGEEWFLVLPRRFLDSGVPRRRYLISTIWFTRGIESSNDEWTVYYANSYVGTDDRDSLLINRGHNAVGERRIVPVLWILMQFLNKDIFGNICLCRYYVIWYYIKKIFCFCNFLKTNGCFRRNNFVRWN